MDLNSHLEHDARLQGTASDTLTPELPEYERPPISEVAISVQFEQLEGFTPAHAGLLWEKLKDRYPKTEYHPPVASVVELFGVRGSQQATLSVVSEFPVGRSWFLSSDNLRLIQVQPDRFIVNWRKLDTETAYPRYANLRQAFSAELAAFLDFVSEHKLGNFEPTQCELTYVNHILAGEGWREHREISNVLALWSGQPSEPYLPEVEESRLNWQYRFDEDAEPIGRMHVQFRSAFRVQDNLPVFVLQLVSRGGPLGSGIDGIISFTDKAHEWIVRGFTAMTTEHMHRVWGRKR